MFGEVCWECKYAEKVHQKTTPIFCCDGLTFPTLVRLRWLLSLLRSWCVGFIHQRAHHHNSSNWWGDTLVQNLSHKIHYPTKHSGPRTPLPPFASLGLITLLPQQRKVPLHPSHPRPPLPARHSAHNVPLPN